MMICFVLSLIEIGTVVPERILKCREWFFAILLFFLLGNGRGHSFLQNRIIFTQGCFVLSLFEIRLID